MWWRHYRYILGFGGDLLTESPKKSRIWAQLAVATFIDVALVDRAIRMPQAPLKAVIFTALPVEFQEVRKFVTGCQEVKHSAGNRYEQGTFRANGRDWQIGGVETGAGDAKSAWQTERAINHYDPQVVF